MKAGCQATSVCVDDLEFFLARIFLYSDLLRKSPYSIRIKDTFHAVTVESNNIFTFSYGIITQGIPSHFLSAKFLS